MENKNLHEMKDENLNDVNGGVSNREYFVYIVVKGDTLSSIANRFSTTVAMLVKLNSIANPDRISIGQKLVVPRA